MNTKIRKKEPKPGKFWITISLIIMLSSIISFFIYKISISKLDYIITKALQDFILFIFDKKEFKKIPIILKITSYYDSVIFLIFILLIVYNFLNIYKTFLLYNLICLGFYLSILFKLIFSHIFNL